MSLVRVYRTENQALNALLKAHPQVEVVPEQRDGLCFCVGEWQRRLTWKGAHAEIHGLVELMDNNPMVCADHVSLPASAATLFLIAAGPLAKAGILVEAPVFLTNLECDEASIQNELLMVGGPEGLQVRSEPMALTGIGVGSLLAKVETSPDTDAYAEMFDECFGRSFFVHEDTTSVWDPELVKGQPHALYRLSIAEDSPHSLLKVRVMADLEGKLGAAQIMHAFNVMCGFEESLPFS